MTEFPAPGSPAQQEEVGGVIGAHEHARVYLPRTLVTVPVSEQLGVLVNHHCVSIL